MEQGLASMLVSNVYGDGKSNSVTHYYDKKGIGSKATKKKKKEGKKNG